MVHPGNETYRTINTLAVDVLDIQFYGRSAHASENADEALNALDAMISYFNGVAQLRQHIKKGQRVHGVILDGGKLQILYLIIHMLVLYQSYIS